MKHRGQTSRLVQGCRDYSLHMSGIKCQSILCLIESCAEMRYFGANDWAHLRRAATCGSRGTSESKLAATSMSRSRTFACRAPFFSDVSLAESIVKWGEQGAANEGTASDFLYIASSASYESRQEIDQDGSAELELGTFPLPAPTWWKPTL